MRAVIQRVSRAQVTVGEEQVGKIGAGLMVLAAVHVEDTEEDIDWMARKIPDLRIFEDVEGKMNRSLVDASGQLLLVSQFTLYGDTQKGRRPSFIESARPEKAVPLLDRLLAAWRALGLTVETGRFGATMAVELVNDGPVTLILDSPRKSAPAP